MKRSKRLFVLLGILLAASLATFAVMRTEEKKEQIKTSGEIVLEVSSEDVKSLSWEYGETSLTFHKEETWLYDDDEAFPVDEEKIHELLEQFEVFGVSFVIEDVTDTGMYGLDAPVCTIQLATEDQSWEITLGDYSSMDSERYVSIGDGNVYLAKNDPLDQFDAVLKDMLDDDEALSYDQVSRIEFEGAENYGIFYEEDSSAARCADDVYFTEQNGKTLPLDPDRVGAYLDNLTTLYLDNYVTYNATDEELASYGLDEPELTVAVDYTRKDEDGSEVSDTFVLSVSRDPEKLAAAEEAEEKGEEAEEVTGYVRVGDSKIVYEISGYSCGNLMAASYDDLRRREVLAAGFEDVYQVDISLENSSFTIAADGEDEDGKRVWKYREEKVELDDFQKALEGLRAGSADSFTVEGSAGREEISLTVYLDNENYPRAEIELCRYDGTNCLAEVDGQTFALISRSDVVDLIEAVHAITLNQPSDNEEHLL